jgi:hypothetical protein
MQVDDASAVWTCRPDDGPGAGVGEQVDQAQHAGGGCVGAAGEQVGPVLQECQSAKYLTAARPRTVVRPVGRT